MPKKTKGCLMAGVAILPKTEPSSPVPEQDRGVIVVEHPDDDEIAALCLMGSMTIPGIAGDAVVRRVVARNRDSLFGIFRLREGVRDDRIPLGFYANLLPSDAGLEAIKAGEFDVADPPVELLVPTGDRPAAVYSWAVLAPGLFEKTLPMLANKMGDLYADLPILTAAATAAGKKTVNRRGFRTDDNGLSTYDQTSDARRSFKRVKA
jgi:hypothetical protein